MTKIAPVYPKQDPEYRKRVMEQFYRQVRETNWGDMSGEYQGKARGRKAKIIENLYPSKVFDVFRLIGLASKNTAHTPSLAKTCSVL
jgi:hypothetical protein